MELLTAEQRAGMRRLHYSRRRHLTFASWCAECAQRWPCTLVQLADAHDEIERLRADANALRLESEESAEIIAELPQRIAALEASGDYGWQRVIVRAVARCNPCGHTLEQGDTAWRKGRFWLCPKCFRAYIIEPERWGPREQLQERLFWRNTDGKEA